MDKHSISYNEQLLKRFRDIKGSREYKLSIVYQWLKQGVISSKHLFIKMLDGVDNQDEK